jgi:hypothetical protein
MGNNIYYVNASVGAGKTTAFVDYVSQGGNIKALYAAPTAKLAAQTHEEIRKRGGKAKLILSPQSMVKLENTPSDLQVVGKRNNIVDSIDEEIAKLVDDTTHNTLVISHVALLLYLDADVTRNKSNLKNIELFIDEQLPVFDFLKFTPDEDTLDTYLDMLHHTHEVDDISRLKCNPQYEDQYDEIIKQRHKRNNLNTRQFAQILASVKRKTSAVFASVGIDSLQTVTIVDPQSFTKRFNKITMMCADFSNTLQYHLFKEVFNVNFLEEKSLSAMVSADTHAHGCMLKLYYLIEDGKKASKSMIIDSKGVSKQAERDMLFEQVADFWPDGKFIYSTHASWTKNGDSKVRVLDKMDDVASVGVKSHGQNQYTEYHRVAALTVCQFPNNVKSILSKLSNKEPNDLNIAFKVESVYQTIGRTAIRTHNFLDEDKEVEAIVLDQETAEKIADIFTDAEVCGRIGNFSKTRKIRKDSTSIPKTVLKYLSSRKLTYMGDKNPPRQKRTREKIKGLLIKYPHSNYKLSDFGL